MGLSAGTGGTGSPALTSHGDLRSTEKATRTTFTFHSARRRKNASSRNPDSVGTQIAVSIPRSRNSGHGLPASAAGSTVPAASRKAAAMPDIIVFMRILSSAFADSVICPRKTVPRSGCRHGRRRPGRRASPWQGRCRCPPRRNRSAPCRRPRAARCSRTSRS